MGVSCWFSIAGLHVTSRRPCRWSRTKVLLSSGNKTLLLCTSFKKKSIVLTLNMAAFRCLVVAYKEYPAKCRNIFQRSLSTSKVISKVTILACCDTVTTLQVKIFVQWPFSAQLFGFSHQGKFLGAKLY